MKNLVIAIDGPSGAGKGTLARSIARALGYRHIDTGAMYRAVAWKATADGLPLDDEAAVAALATRADLDQHDGLVLIDQHDVTRIIRTPEVDQAAARVAKLPRVREILVERQRALGAGGAVVMEGRDIGTVVFPEADVKIYLDASAEERARRRVSDQARSGVPRTSMASVQSELVARDRTDSTRAIAPLTVAPDAVYIDTTSMPIEAVVNHVIMLVHEKLTT